MLAPVVSAQLSSAQLSSVQPLPALAVFTPRQFRPSELPLRRFLGEEGKSEGRNVEQALLGWMLASALSRSAGVLGFL